MSSDLKGYASTYGAASRTSYLFGVAVRWAVDLVSAPYRALAGRGPSRRRPRSSFDHGAPRRRISRNLTRMMERLHSIEQRLIGSSGKDTLGSLTDEIEAMRQVTERLGTEHSPRIGTDPGELRYALGDLDSIPADERTAMILGALQDPRPELRCLAAQAAAREGSSATVFSLILSLDDTNAEVRREVKAAIESITGASIDFDPERDDASRDVELERLKGWWKEERFNRLTAELESALKP